MPRLTTGLIGFLIGLAFVLAALILDRIWFKIVPWDIFLKLTATIAVTAGLAVFLILIRADFAEHKRLKDENYLD